MLLQLLHAFCRNEMFLRDCLSSFIFLKLRYIHISCLLQICMIQGRIFFGPVIPGLWPEKSMSVFRLWYISPCARNFRLTGTPIIPLTFLVKNWSGLKIANIEVSIFSFAIILLLVTLFLRHFSKALRIASSRYLISSCSPWF